MSHTQKQLRREVPAKEFLEILSKLNGHIVFKCDELDGIFLLKNGMFSSLKDIVISKTGKVMLYSDGSFVIADEDGKQYSFTMHKTMQYIVW